MASNLPGVGTQAVVEAAALGQLITSLRKRGYEVAGPVARDGAIVYDTIESAEDLPAGCADQQEPGRYRMTRSDGKALFGFAAGPQSWKKYLHPADIPIVEAERGNGSFRILQPDASPRKRAFLGVRPCDLAAIAIQDRVLLGDRYVDSVYRGNREGVFLVCVNCTRPSSSCFCTSMNTGPRAEKGFDLALTELADGDRHRFLAEAGSAAGAEVLAEVEHSRAGAEARKEAEKALAGAAASISRRLDTSGIRELLYDSFDSPRWDQVAARCLSCANCTMVCPTCFCITVEDTSEVGGGRASRRRKWDSCFTQSFSYIHGGSVRLSAKSRYRQWLTHKLAAWVDQFGSSGCVGCGRCITWCPAAIDITEEAAAIRGGARAADGEGGRKNEAAGSH